MVINANITLFSTGQTTLAIEILKHIDKYFYSHQRNLQIISLDQTEGKAVLLKCRRPNGSKCQGFGCEARDRCFEPMYGRTSWSMCEINRITIKFHQDTSMNSKVLRKNITQVQFFCLRQRNNIKNNKGTTVCTHLRCL